MTRAAQMNDPASLAASTSVAAVGIHQLAIITETDAGSPLHHLGRAARAELGRPQPIAVGGLTAAVIGLGVIPRGNTKDERQIARALMAFRALLRAWDAYDRGRNARLLAIFEEQTGRLNGASSVHQAGQAPSWAYQGSKSPPRR